MAAGSEWQDNDLVFCQENGRPIDPRSDHRAWRALLADGKVRQARLHDARHTAATLLLQQGVPARVAMEMLGHSQISLTLGHLLARDSRAGRGRHSAHGRGVVG